MDKHSFWNCLQHSTPVILSNALRCKNPYDVVVHLKLVMNQIKQSMHYFNQLSQEAATLSRFIYKTKHKLRQEKSFKTMQKINRCLTNYITMHLPFTLSSIQETLHNDCGPSQQMMEWTLVRLYGVTHLFHRVYLLCIDAAGHLFVRLKLGHLWDSTFFSVAIISRIWTLSQFIVHQTCNWYKSLYQFLDKLEPSPTPWLPPSFVLPSDLMQTFDKSQYPKLRSEGKLNETLFQLNITPLTEKTKVEIARDLSAIIDLDGFDDIGESITKEMKNNSSMTKEENKTISQNNKSFHPTYIHSIKEIRSSGHLANFISVEASFRNLLSNNSNSNHKPLLGNVDKLQWSLIEKFIHKQIKILNKLEECGKRKQQEKLLQKVRKNIKLWSC